MYQTELAKLLLQEKEKRIVRERKRLTAGYWQGIYAELGEEFRKIAGAYKLLEEETLCRVVPEKYEGRGAVGPQASAAEAFLEMLSAEKALRTGRGLLVRCNLRDHYGDASAEEPRGFKGRVAEAGGMVLGKPGERSLFFSVLNALYNFTGTVQETVHCKWEQMEACGQELVDYIREKFGKKATVAHIGYKPEHTKFLSRSFKTYVTEALPEFIGKRESKIRILDETKNEEIIKKSDVACIPGCAAVNGTLPGLLKWCEDYKTEPLLYGVTVAASAKILKLPHFCPFARRHP